MPQTSHRLEKFSSTLQQNLAQILLTELSNPEFKLVTISHVIVSPDLRHAQVFVSSLKENMDEVITELESASGFIKHLLGRRMRLRYIPELVFHKDRGYEMEQAIAQMAKPRP